MLQRRRFWRPTGEAELKPTLATSYRISTHLKAQIAFVVIETLVLGY